MTKTATVILAGGRGERLGGALKAGIEIGGRTMLERVDAVLRPQAEPVLVACGHHPPEALPLLPGQIPVADPPGLAGPLAGLAAAAIWLQRQERSPDYLISVAVDTPFLPFNFPSRLAVAAAAGAAAVIAAYDGQTYPTNALWRFDRLLDLPWKAEAEPSLRSPKGLAGSLAATILPWPPAASGDPFASVNTPAELAAARARFGLGQ